MNKITRVIIHNPFDNGCRTIEAFDGPCTIKELKSDLPASHPAITLTTTLNGAEASDSDIVKPGDVVTIIPSVASDNDKRNVGIAAVLAATISGNVWASSLGNAWASAAVLTATMAVNQWGMRRIAKLWPIGEKRDESQSAYSWNPATTQQEGQVVPRIYGTWKTHGNIIATRIDYLFEGAGDDKPNDENVNVLLDIGTGPYEEISDLKLNGRGIANYSGAKVETRLGEIVQEPVSFFEVTETTIDGSPTTLEIDAESFYEVTIPAGNHTEIGFYLNFPTGLFWGDARKFRTAKLEIDAQPGYGGGLWTPFVNIISVPSYEDATGIEISVVPTSIAKLEGWYQCVVGTEPPVVFPDSPYSSDRSAHTEYEPANIQRDITPILYNGDIYPTTVKRDAEWRWVDKSYGCQYDTGGGFAASQLPRYKEQFAFSLKYTMKVQKNTQYKIRFKRVSNGEVDEVGTESGNQIQVQSVFKVIPGSFTYPRTALVGIQSLATKDLSGSFDFSAIVKGALVFDGTYDATIHPNFVWSDNPAWVCWDVLTGPVIKPSATRAGKYDVVRYDGINPSYLDLTTFDEWAEFCATMVTINGTVTTHEPRITFNGVFDEQMTRWEAAHKVAAMARAMLIQRGTMLSVMVDSPRTDDQTPSGTLLPTQLFNVATIGVDSFEQTWLPLADRAGSIEVEFNDKDDDYERKMIAKVEPTLAIDNRITMDGFGVTRASQAQREALWRLNRNKLLQISAKITMNSKAIGASLGDLIIVQQDVTSWGEGGMCSADSLIEFSKVTIYLDRLHEGGAVGKTVMWQKSSNDAIKTAEIMGTGATLDNLGYIEVAKDFADADYPLKYDRWIIGTVDQNVVGKPFTVIGADKEGADKISLSLLEYDKTLYEMDDGFISDDVPKTGNIGVYPIAAVTYSEELSQGTDYYDSQLRVTLTPGRYEITEGKFVELNFGRAIVKLYEADGELTYVPRRVVVSAKDAVGFVTFGVYKGKTYAVDIECWDKFGKFLGVKSFGVHYVAGKTFAPSAAGNVTFDDLRLSWDAVTDIDFSHYVVKFSHDNGTPSVTASPIDYTMTSKGKLLQSYFDLTMIPNYGKMTITTFDRSGNEEVSAELTITEPTLEDGVITIYDFKSQNWPSKNAGAYQWQADVSQPTTIQAISNSSPYFYKEEITQSSGVYQVKLYFTVEYLTSSVSKVFLDTMLPYALLGQVSANTLTNLGGDGDADFDLIPTELVCVTSEVGGGFTRAVCESKWAYVSGGKLKINLAFWREDEDSNPLTTPMVYLRSFYIESNKVGASGDVVVKTAGQTIDAGRLVYVDSSGKAMKCDAAHPIPVGIVVDQAASGFPATIYKSGVVPIALSGYTTGQELWASPTDYSFVTQTPPEQTVGATHSIPVGRVLSEDDPNMVEFKVGTPVIL